MADSGRKKWFMLQMWRLQQVAQILTIVLLTFNVSLMLWGYVKWRNEWLANPVTGVLSIMLPIIIAMWIFAILWDVRFKMWREQLSVLVEKNPYMKERMSPKEIAVYAITWLPVLDHLGKTDPGMKARADTLRAWLKKETFMDDYTAKEVEDILSHVGSSEKDLFGLKEK